MHVFELWEEAALLSDQSKDVGEHANSTQRVSANHHAAPGLP